ncbi:poly-beta-hydroxybutyrate polymerase [Massilia sp. CCM 8733]|uniref:Poly-beta-hydroxybutyrate polymerase n=1 Tax=Massilia mucilaginosa TaxID=2609282 RepID=A0ABX0NZK5_9BURK|nr:alpha/beta fold hydrolase [Massilia mucilaginosa]NHZ92438.1 poly-beta-hydroxybutyrate polymerase [Massilia mucilaginosa]
MPLPSTSTTLTELSDRRGAPQATAPPDIEPPSPLDRYLHAMQAQLTQGISPTSLALAHADWLLNLMQSPAKWQRLLHKAWTKEMRWLDYALRSTLREAPAPCIEPLPQDRRFRSPAWQRWPYDLMQQAFLLNQQWWHNATTGIDGVSRHHQDVVSFTARQLLDLASPLNVVATNPEVDEATVREAGANLVRGAMNLADDTWRSLAGMPPAGTDAFRPGIEVAVTPGQVVFRNHLIELIQYDPAPGSASVCAEPMLIVPAWIMKYYILDLSPHNSLVRYLVGHGHTVFMMSWRNPDAQDRDLGMDDYLRDGIMAALGHIRGVAPGQRIDTAGYCLGGTLLSIAVASLGCEGEALINSMTLLAAQTDFSEAGELMLFIDDNQISFLEDLMWQQGYLDNRQMAGAFRLLRSNDLVWSRAINQYLLGKRAPMTDLMAWNADTTRMPYRMHSEYLRKLFLDNDLCAGRYQVDGRPVALGDIRAPLFVVATMTDHVSPWRSVYKIHLVSPCDVHFVLTSGGHNAGIVSEPGHGGRRYHAAHRPRGECYLDPDRWLAQAGQRDGSWWPAWTHWLDAVSRQPRLPPRQVQGGLAPAPGTYVLQR